MSKPIIELVIVERIPVNPRVPEAERTERFEVVRCEGTTRVLPDDILQKSALDGLIAAGIKVIIDKRRGRG